MGAPALQFGLHDVQAVRAAGLQTHFKMFKQWDTPSGLIPQRLTAFQAVGAAEVQIAYCDVQAVGARVFHIAVHNV